MFSRFFIERPIFANVIAIVTMILGVVALIGLPIEQYPSITPPTVQVATTFPGANARVLADTVAAPIEKEVNGVEHMLYMQSTCANDGTYNLTITFEVGTDLDTAQVLVQNRLAFAEPRLPEEVKRQGVTAKKQSTSILQVFTLTSPDGRFDDLYLSNYADRQVKDVLSRIYGVGDVRVFGSGEYAMRVWLDPEKLKARGLTTQDVVQAIQEQNVQVAAGQLGQPPSPEGQGFQYTINTLGRLSDVEQFENIIVKSAGESRFGGRITRVRDVARVELGGQVYDAYCLANGVPAAGVAIFLLPGANALDVAHRCKAAMDDLEKTFPPGLRYDTVLDTTEFVEEAIAEVYKTLYEAGFLVLVVILVFLQDWRAVLVPATTVPVTILGAFIGMAALGFSINLLTLFGLILAIGIVVDDAIVIVENAAHHIDHDKLDAKNATIKAMGEVLGPIIGITLVLMAVFVPSAFLGGIVGQLYRQFALTIAATAIISAINAVTLKPAQCATYLRPTPPRRNLLVRVFNGVYGWFENIYTACVKFLVRHVALTLAVFAGLVAFTGWLYVQLPTGFLPNEDQGYAIIGVQLPDAASQSRTRAVLAKIDEILADADGVEKWTTIGGRSVLDQATASNAATIYVKWAPFEERTTPELSQEAIVDRLRKRLGGIEEAIAFVLVPPAIRGLGVSGGFQMQVQEKGEGDLIALQRVVQEMMADGNTQSGLKALNTSFRAEVPQVFADIDRTKAKTLNVPLSTVFNTLQSYLGSAYVNDFTKFGRPYQVRVQADQRFRNSVEDIERLEVRNASGRMIPLGSIAKVEQTVGPQIVNRYNLYPAALLTGEAAPGYSSGQALKLMEDMAAEKLPPSMGYEWTGMSFEEKKAGSQGAWIFALAVLLVYLVLAAQYESWVVPIGVILVVPLGLLGAAAAVAIRGMDNNIYTQIGIVLIIALASKNAILIVEFARDLRLRRGRGIREAAVEAARLRFRPILMTSFAFILGVYPLVVARGAGAVSRQALGTAVFGGMIASTILAVFFVPVFFVVVQWLGELRGKGKKGADAPTPTAPGYAADAHPDERGLGHPNAPPAEGHAAGNGHGHGHGNAAPLEAPPYTTVETTHGG
jgi:HAE1 family hydrophobic/amphiphilic exporter-1